MTTSQELDIRISKITDEINTLNAKETLAEGEATKLEELSSEYSAKGAQFRAALTVEGEAESRAQDLFAGDAETRELAQLTKRANVGDILSATFEKRQTSGEAAELQKHFGLGSHQVPLEMLRINRSVEERAAATVPASIGDASQAPVITPVFASGDGAFLGIERPTVAVGDAAYPVLSTMPSVKGPFTDSSEAAQTDAEFVATNLES